jgi:serine/threonine protein kinase
MAPASLEGQTLGKYRVLEPLGRGGMAQVYRAYHPQLDRYVAIKVLRSDLVEEEEFLSRFRREARAVAGLRHPNIVQVFDFDVQDDVYFMVMEVLEGDTLKSYLTSYRMQGKRIPLGDMVRILLDVLEGLGYAHHEGIVHRDIKPANILLTQRGRAVLTDFGIAQIIGGTQYTVSGALMGTLNYMSPEQGLEGRGDNRSDLYSLGIVYYEMLTGKTPFDADTPLAILMKHLNDPLPLPRKDDPTIPESFERVVLKVLAKQPDDRYQSAAEMAQALRDAAQQAGIALTDNVSLPKPVTISEASPAVFSGSARQLIPDKQFAEDNTDAALGKRLQAERQAEGASTFPTVKLDFEKIKQNLKELLSKLSTMEVPELGVTRAITFGAGLFIVANLCAVTMTTATGRGEIFGRGWPMELLLLSVLVSLFMSATDIILLLIPAGFLLGNGILFSYYSITGFWFHWTFLWPLEPLLIIGTIFGTLWMYKQPERFRGLARRLGYYLAITGVFWGALVAMFIAAIVVLHIF